MWQDVKNFFTTPAIPCEHFDPAQQLTCGGQRWISLPESFPALKPLYSTYELTYSGEQLAAWYAQHATTGVTIVAAYLTFIWLGQRYMQSRKAVPVPPRVLATWNFVLATFSLVGLLRTAPHLGLVLWRAGLLGSMCEPGIQVFGNGPSGFWVALFILSKVPELLDTFWLVIRKRPVIFLHWYHHASVLAFCWHAFATHNPAGLWFATMNYGVHALMYTFYGLASIGRKPAWAGIVTSLQIAQMFIGMGIVAATIIAPGCNVDPTNAVFAGVIYTSYMVLFVLFAIKRYGSRSGSSGSTDKVKSS